MPRAARRRVIVVVVAVVLSLALALGWTWRPVAAVPSSREVGAPGAAAVAPRHAAALPPREERAEPNHAEVPRPERGYLAGHAAIAQALGYVAVSCWIGTEWDTESLGGYQKIKGGWYSDVKRELVGEDLVTRRYPRPSDEPAGELTFEEPLFYVSWAASAPGQEVPCTVRYPIYAELRVAVVGADGAPVEGAQVYGCSSQGRSEGGVALLEQALAGEDCALHGNFGVHAGYAMVSALAENEIRTLTLLVSEDAAPPVFTPAPATLRRSPEEELAALRTLSEAGDLSADGAQLVGQIIAHLELRKAWEAGRLDPQAMQRDLLAAETAEEMLALAEAQHERIQANMALFHEIMKPIGESAPGTEPTAVEEP
jgi:hypothetical protein